jgi:polyferredoxin
MFDKKKVTSKLRLIIQLAFFILVLGISIAHTMNWGGENLHGLCPFGGVEALYTYITTGSYIHHLGQANYILVFALLLTLILTGSFFCGWICPLGSVQEWLGKLGKKIRGKKYNQIPKKLDRILRYLKYLVLAVVIIQTARSFTLVFENIDPYYNLFNIWTDEISITGYISVIVVLTLSLFIERPFCRYACPLGALNGLFNSFSILNIKRNQDSCIDCKVCDLSCPANIEVSKQDKIKDTACIRCMECVKNCPVNEEQDTLNVSLPIKKTKALKGVSYALLVLVVFMTPIGISKSIGNFSSEEEQVYQSADDIRGSYTIENIINNYELDRKLFYRAFAVPQDVGVNTKIKELEDVTNISVEGIRQVIGNLKQPLKSIVTQLPNNLDATQSITEFIQVKTPGAINKLLATEEVEILDEQGEEIVVKRKTMLIEIKKIVIDFDDFKKTFQIPTDKPLNTNIKTLEEDYGIDITEVREYIAQYKK